MGNIRIQKKASDCVESIQHSDSEGQDEEEATFEGDEQLEEDYIRTDSYFASCLPTNHVEESKLIESTTTKDIIDDSRFTANLENDADSSVGSANISLPLSDSIIPDSFDKSTDHSRSLSSGLGQPETLKLPFSPTIALLSDALSRISLQESTQILNRDIDLDLLDTNNSAKEDGPPPERQLPPKKLSQVRTDLQREDNSLVTQQCATDTKSVLRTEFTTPDSHSSPTERPQLRKKPRSGRSSMATSDVEGTDSSTKKQTRHQKCAGREKAVSTTAKTTSSGSRSASRKQDLRGGRRGLTVESADLCLGHAANQQKSGNLRVPDHTSHTESKPPLRRMDKQRITHKMPHSTKEIVHESLPDSCRIQEPPSQEQLGRQAENTSTLQAKNVTIPNLCKDYQRDASNLSQLKSYGSAPRAELKGQSNLAETEPFTVRPLESYEALVQDFTPNIEPQHHRNLRKQPSISTEQFTGLDPSFWQAGAEAYPTAIHPPKRKFAPMTSRMDHLADYWRRIHETWDAPAYVDFQTNARPPPIGMDHRIYAARHNVGYHQERSFEDSSLLALDQYNMMSNQPRYPYEMPQDSSRFKQTPPRLQSISARATRRPSHEPKLPPRHQPQHLPRTIRSVTSMPMMNQTTASAGQNQWAKHSYHPTLASSEQGFHNNPPPPQVLNLQGNHIVPASPQVPENDFSSRLMHDFSARARQHSVIVRPPPENTEASPAPMAPPSTVSTNEGAVDTLDTKQMPEIRTAVEISISHTKPEEVLSWRGRNNSALKTKMSMPSLRYVAPGARGHQKTADTDLHGSNSTSPQKLEDGATMLAVHNSPPLGASPKPILRDTPKENAPSLTGQPAPNTGGKFGEVESVRMRKPPPRRTVTRYPTRRVAMGGHS